MGNEEPAPPMLPNRAIFEGKRALVIGGSGGIGAVVSKVAGKLGASVIVHGGHNRERAESVVSSIRTDGGVAESLIGPIETVREAVDLIDAVKSIDILAVVYGPLERTAISDIDEAAWTRMVTANLTVPGVLISRMLPSMVANGFGRIVLFGGTGTDVVRGFKTMAHYAAAKTALGVLAKSVAIAHANHNVCCNVLVPGFVDTEYLTDEERREYRALSANGRLAKPREYAEIIRTILVAEAGIPNGAVIDLSSGSFRR